MKLINKITFIIIFLLLNINAFAAISSFVDDIDVPANGSNGQWKKRWSKDNLSQFTDLRSHCFNEYKKRLLKEKN